MHAGNPERSRRLARLLDLLQASPRGITTAEIQIWTGSMAPATDVSELRQSGYRITRTCEGKNKNGRQVNRYTLLGKLP